MKMGKVVIALGKLRDKIKVNTHLGTETSISNVYFLRRP